METTMPTFRQEEQKRYSAEQMRTDLQIIDPDGKPGLEEFLSTYRVSGGKGSETLAACIKASSLNFLTLQTLTRRLATIRPYVERYKVAFKSKNVDVLAETKKALEDVIKVEMPALEAAVDYIEEKATDYLASPVESLRDRPPEKMLNSVLAVLDTIEEGAPYARRTFTEKREKYGKYLSTMRELYNFINMNLVQKAIAERGVFSKENKKWFELTQHVQILGERLKSAGESFVGLPIATKFKETLDALGFEVTPEYVPVEPKQ